MKFKVFILFISITLGLASCGTSFGKKIEFGNLEVFYSDFPNASVYANLIGDFFIDNNLVLDTPHSIKLTSNNNSFVLKFILDSKYNALPIEKEAELKALELAIKNKIFADVNFKIELCDVNFYPLNLKN